MLPGAFKFCAPSTISEACSELDRVGDEGRLLAGGVELMPLIRRGEINVGSLIDIKGIRSLNGIRAVGGDIQIGSTATHYEIAQASLVREHLPVLWLAARSVGNIRTRNQGTLGGNIAAMGPHSDPRTALLSMEATVTLVDGPHRCRKVPLEAFIPGAQPGPQSPTEVLTSVVVPIPPPYAGQGFARYTAASIPIANAASTVVMERGRIASSRLAFGCRGVVGGRLRDLEDGLIGVTPDESLKVLSGGVRLLEDRVDPVSDMAGSPAFKVYVISMLLRNALTHAVAQSQAGIK